MKISIVCFSEEGSKRAAAIQDKMAEEIQIFYKGSLKEVKGARKVQESISEWSRTHWNEDALIFIGSCGIALRAVASCVESKLTDPAVLVIDEKGIFCISLLSGHLGGANELCRQISSTIGARAVITTASDVNGLLAIDLWADQQGIAIADKEAVKEFAAKLLRRDQVVVAGIGCKKGTPYERIRDVVEEACKEIKIQTDHIKLIASIDLKKEEEGLVAYAKSLQLPFVTYSSQVLARVQGEFSASSFVKEITGVDNVCERSALASCKDGRLLMKKYAKQGVTVAFAIENNGMFGEKINETT